MLFVETYEILLFLDSSRCSSENLTSTMQHLMTFKKSEKIDLKQIAMLVCKIEDYTH